jgi:hypothetical protein
MTNLDREGLDLVALSASKVANAVVVAHSESVSSSLAELIRAVR